MLEFPKNANLSYYHYRQYVINVVSEDKPGLLLHDDSHPNTPLQIIQNDNST